MPAQEDVGIEVRLLFRPRGIRADATLQVPAEATVLETLRLAGVHPDSCIVLRGDDPVPVDSPIRPGETLEVVQVVSGGAGTPSRARGNHHMLRPG